MAGGGEVYAQLGQRRGQQHARGARAHVLLLATIGYSLYKWRLRSHMDHEIRSILTQYMPLDNAAGGAVGTGAGGPGDFEDAPTASGYGPPPAAGSKKVELGMSSSTAKDKEDE